MYLACSQGEHHQLRELREHHDVLPHLLFISSLSYLILYLNVSYLPLGSMQCFMSSHLYSPHIIFTSSSHFTSSSYLLLILLISSVLLPTSHLHHVCTVSNYRSPTFSMQCFLPSTSHLTPLAHFLIPLYLMCVERVMLVLHHYLGCWSMKCLSSPPHIFTTSIALSYPMCISVSLILVHLNTSHLITSRSHHLILPTSHIPSHTSNALRVLQCWYLYLIPLYLPPVFSACHL